MTVYKNMNRHGATEKEKKKYTDTKHVYKNMNRQCIQPACLTRTLYETITHKKQAISEFDRTMLFYI